MKSLGIEKIPAAGGLADYRNGAIERRFSPYSDNGGSLVAIAGEDYAIIASDTRLSGLCTLFTLCAIFPLLPDAFFCHHEYHIFRLAFTYGTGTVWYRFGSVFRNLDLRIQATEV
jgi:hypothetical protein